MKLKRLSKLMALLAAFALFAAACGGDDDNAAPADQPSATTADTMDDPEDEMSDGMDEMDEMSMPGEGHSITMGRADWSTGYFHAQIFKQMLEKLGYEVSEPSENELGPSLAYLAMAEGDIDFWANSWYPGHNSWLQPELPDGTQIGDHVEVVGELMLAGGLQGFLITKATADEYGITHMDQINDDPEIRALFDADGDGDADIYGCQESWTCDDIFTNQIAFNGWDNIEQTIAGYDAMIAEATAKMNAGEPAAIYTWTPSAYITQMRPGDNAYWLSMEDVLDDSNPAGLDGGEAHDQRAFTSTGEPFRPDISADECPGAATDGFCELGWVPADILVTANKEFLEANPAAEELFRLATISVLDVSLANVQQEAGQDTEAEIAQLAADWISDNQATVDGWLEAARAAA